ncbi:MAG: FKBP-type peptidyl-prolyl cis-trans isomerase [Ferruginibacter sp.]|nr:FKBP-type peptidyl-prolyl cis-trans isomerase [Ferruginibacter sp.]
MKYKFLFFALLITGKASFAQTEDGFIKGDNNIEYKIFPSASGNIVQYGNYLKMHIVQMYRGTKDSILYDSKNYTSPIQPLDTAGSSGLPLYYYDVLKQLKNNDSVVMRIVVDSAFKNTGVPMPPTFEPGKHIYTCLKIEDVYESKAKADEEMVKQQQKMAEANMARDADLFKQQNAILESYFKANKITNIIKAPKGTFIQILKKGIGKNVTPMDKVKVNYTGKTFAGKMFDSNTNPQFGHVTPLEVDLSQTGRVIVGWEEGLTYLNKGSKAKLYVPSPIGFGTMGTGDGNIEPNEILIFDIDIVEIIGANNKPVTSKPTIKKATVSKPKVKAKKK